MEKTRTEYKILVGKPLGKVSLEEREHVRITLIES
jgi:predicted DNA-binding antitoxin AbrB/MazE fold protein